MGNPFIKNSKIFSVYIFIWASVALAHLLIAKFILDVDFDIAAVESLVFNTLYFFIGLSLWYPTKFISFETNTSGRIVINHFGAALITSGFWVLVGYFILSRVFAENTEYLHFLDSSLFWRFIIGVFFYSVEISINYVSIYYENFQQKQLKEAELRSLVKESELRSLKYQINPHFIFNSLNSISSLTISDPPKAQEMTIKLSSFLRSTLSKNEKQLNKLEEEIKNVRLYLDIEKIRFGDNFDYTEEFNDSYMQKEIPSMILQPLFENAIKHGVYESIDPVTIKISCEPENGYIKITVENNFDPEAVSHKGEGIGLKNIANRLKLTYNQDNLLTTYRSNNTYKAVILIPNKEVEE